MNIIPQPHKIVTGSPLDERYLVNKQVFTNTEGHLPRYLNEKLNLKVNRISLEKNYAILISRALNNYLPRLPEILLEQEEGYYLNMSRENVSIVSASERGLFYGIQTLLQIKSDHGLRETEITDWPDNRVRGFHLELRYGIPIQERVLQIIDELAYYKFNTLIIEYEDKFPFDKYSDIVSKNAFSAEQITEIQEYASNRYIDIIPLQQTLGHLEYILKNDQYNHLKELEYGGIESEYPFSINRETGFLHLNDIDEICPTNQASYELIDALCTEMALKHPGSR